MKEWIKNILIPYRELVIEADPNLDDNQKCILFIDAYPVHAGAPFTQWIYSFKMIILIFVPQNCTGIFQPADVGLQCPIKHRLKQHLFKWMASTHQQQMASGLWAKDVKITTSLPAFCNASVAGLVQVYDFFLMPDGRDLIKKVHSHYLLNIYLLITDMTDM